LLRSSDSDAFTVDAQEFEQMKIALHPVAPVMLLVGQIEATQASAGYSERMQLLHSVRLLAAQYMGPHLRYAAVLDERDQFCWFIQPAQEQGAEEYRRAEVFLKGTLETMQGVCRESLHAAVSFALSGQPVAWSDVSAKYFELAQMLGYRVGGLETLLVDSEFETGILSPEADVALCGAEADAQPLEALMRHPYLELLELHLERGEKARYFSALRPVTDVLRTIRSKNSNLAIEAYGRLALGLLGYINRWRLTEKLAFHVGQYKLMRIDAFDTWAQAADYIEQVASILFLLQDQGSARRADSAVEQIQRYVHQHLEEDLSLVRLAERARLNPSYLSRLYKQVTGENLSEFIDGARMRGATELLAQPEIRIHEVARRVGYETAASFTRFFRKQAGMSPQAYRDGKRMQTK
jgi:two-component system response regulator YesN